MLGAETGIGVASLQTCLVPFLGVPTASKIIVDDLQALLRDLQFMKLVEQPQMLPLSAMRGVLVTCQLVQAPGIIQTFSLH